jgi:hypothetical protein
MGGRLHSGLKELAGSFSGMQDILANLWERARRWDSYDSFCMNVSRQCKQDAVDGNR